MNKVRFLRFVLMRFVRPALYFPVDMFRFFPGSVTDESGLKRKIIGIVVTIDKPLLALNKRWYAEETNQLSS